MKNRFFVFLFSIVCLFFIISCKATLTEVPSDHSDIEKGQLSGKVVFANTEENNNSGIIVSIEKTDGLRTVAVTNAVASRSVENSSNNTILFCETNEDGSYTFNNLEEGVYTIYASSNHSLERAVFTNACVRSGETTIAETLKLTATGSIKGKVTFDNATTGNTGFLVFVTGTSFMAMTADDGSYIISGIPAGQDYQLAVVKDDIIHLISTNVTVNPAEIVIVENDVFTAEEIEAAALSKKGEKGDKGDKGNDGTNGTDGTKGNDGISITWLGSFESSAKISNPKKMDAYYNTTDGCSYIFDGNNWTLLAKAGANGSSSTVEPVMLPLSVSSYLSNEERTNQDVIITVKPTRTNLQKIGYVYSENRINYVTAREILENPDFETISNDSNGVYSFNAPLSGYYAIAVKDNDGDIAFVQEFVSNIDKEAPAVIGFDAEYDYYAGKISLTWTKPTDPDFVFTNVSYTINGVAFVTDAHVTEGSYELNNISDNNDVYVFTLYHQDNLGNKSQAQTKTVKADCFVTFTSFNIPVVNQRISNTITAIINGQNFTDLTVDSSNFSVSCSQDSSIVADSSFTFISNTVLQVTLTIPENIGQYNVTVSYNGNASISSIFDVINITARTPRTGDLLLDDGTIILNNFDGLGLSEEQKSKVVGVYLSRCVICYDSEGGECISYNEGIGWISIKQFTQFKLSNYDIDHMNYYNILQNGVSDSWKNYQWRLPTQDEFTYIDLQKYSLNSILTELDVNPLYLFHYGQDSVDCTRYWTSTLGQSEGAYIAFDLAPRNGVQIISIGPSSKYNGCFILPWTY